MRCGIAAGAGDRLPQCGDGGVATMIVIKKKELRWCTTNAGSVSGHCMTARGVAGAGRAAWPAGSRAVAATRPAWCATSTAVIGASPLKGGGVAGRPARTHGDEDHCGPHLSDPSASGPHRDPSWDGRSGKFRVHARRCQRHWPGVRPYRESYCGRTIFGFRDVLATGRWAELRFLFEQERGNELAISFRECPWVSCVRHLRRDRMPSGCVA